MIKTYVGIHSLTTLETGVLYESNSRKGSIMLMLMVNSIMLSYLIDRPQRMVLDKCSSQPLRLSCGVPQGSVLGQVLIFSQYFSIGGCNYGSRLKSNDVRR